MTSQNSVDTLGWPRERIHKRARFRGIRRLVHHEGKSMRFDSINQRRHHILFEGVRLAIYEREEMGNENGREEYNLTSSLE